MDAPYAFATLVTSDYYLPGALAVAAALKDLHPSPPVPPEVPFQTLCLVTPESVDVSSVKILRRAFDIVIGVEIIEQEDGRGLQLLGRPDLNLVLTKLHIFRLTQYAKVIFLDADVLPTRPLSHLFSLPHEFSAVPDVGWPDIFNSGVMVFTPGEDKFQQLTDLFKSKGSWDGGDQGILNEWRGNDWYRLSFTYNTTPTAVYTYAPAYERFGSQISAIHFIGPNKPWSSVSYRSPGVKYGQLTDKSLNTQAPSYDYDSLVDRWYEVYDKHYRSDHIPEHAHFEFSRYDSVWDDGTNYSVGAEMARPPSAPPPGAALGLDDLRKIAVEGISSYNVASQDRPRVGEYRSMPLEGRVDLMRPRKEPPHQQEETQKEGEGRAPDQGGDQNLTPKALTGVTGGAVPRMETLPTPLPHEVPSAPYHSPLELSPSTPPAPREPTGSYVYQQQSQQKQKHQSQGGSFFPSESDSVPLHSTTPPPAGLHWVTHGERRFFAQTAPHYNESEQSDDQRGDVASRQPAWRAQESHRLHPASPLVERIHVPRDTQRVMHPPIHAHQSRHGHQSPRGNDLHTPRGRMSPRGAQSPHGHHSPTQNRHSPPFGALQGSEQPYHSFSHPPSHSPSNMHSHSPSRQYSHQSLHQHSHHSPSQSPSQHVSQSPYYQPSQPSSQYLPQPSYQHPLWSFHQHPPHSYQHPQQQSYQHPQQQSYQHPQRSHQLSQANYTSQPEQSHRDQEKLPRPVSPPKLEWNPAVEPPPKTPPPPSAFPVDTYFPNIWDQAPSREHDATFQTSSGHLSVPQSETFFHPPPAPEIPEQLLREGNYESVIGRTLESSQGSPPVPPTPDRSKVHAIFPWEEKPRHAPRRVFPASESPPPVTNFIDEPTPPKSPSRSEHPTQQFHPPPVGLPPTLTYANAWDTVPSIQRYASKLVRPHHSVFQPPPPDHDEGWRRWDEERERVYQEKQDASSMDGDDEDEGDDEETNGQPVRYENDRERGKPSRTRAGSVAVVMSRQGKNYRGRGVQTIPVETRSMGVQVNVWAEEVEAARKGPKLSRGSGIGTKQWPPIPTGVGLLPPVTFKDADQMAVGTPNVVLPPHLSVVPFPGKASPTGLRSPQTLGSPRTYSPPVVQSPKRIPTPPPKPSSPSLKIASPQPLSPRRVSPPKGGASSPRVVMSPRRLSGVQVPSKLTGSPKPPGSPVVGLSASSSPRQSPKLTKLVSPFSPPLHRMSSNDTMLTSSPSTPGPIETPEGTPLLGPMRKGARVWDPARGVDVFKRSSEEVLARFLRSGSFDEDDSQRRHV